MKLLLLVVSISFSLKLWAKKCAPPTPWSCTETHVCNLIREFKDMNCPPVMRVEQVISINGDPHHFSPSVQDFKKLMKTSHLILPPYELQHWIKNLKPQPQQSRIALELPDNIPYQGSREALAHFWYYPELICHFRSQLSQIFRQEKNSNCPEQKHLEQLKRIAKRFQGKTFILSHDAVAPLFKSLGLDIIVLKGSHHHEEISPATLKRIEDRLKNPSPIVWYLENELGHANRAIAKKIRLQDQKLTVSLKVSPNAAINTDLVQLIQSLEGVRFP